MATTQIDIEQTFGIVPISLPTHFPVGPVNAFLLKEDPPVLVDTGLRSDESYDVLADALREQGYVFGDLGAIIATHGHRDHMGLLGRLLKESYAVAYGHPLLQKQGQAREEDGVARKQFYIDILHEFGLPDEIKEQANSLYDRFRALAEPFEIDHEVEDGAMARQFRVHFVPGHSPSDTLFIDEDREVTFVGDHILTSTNPNPLIRRPPPGEPRAKALVEYRASLHKSRELDLGVCCPGHGQPFDNHVEVIERILAKQDQRSEQVLKLVRSGHATPFSISKTLFPTLPLPNIHLGLSIAIGHLEILEEDGVVAREDTNDVAHFVATP